MMFRPLALAAAFAGSIGLSSAEINYAYHEGELASTNDLSSGAVGVQLASKIAAPGSKDLILSLSSEINLVTQTAAKGTNGKGKDTSEASAGVFATLKYCVDCPEKGDYDSVADAICNGGSSNVYEALPGSIAFSCRRQELSVDVNLECEVSGDPAPDCEVTGYVEVDLELDTTAAHSFTFIADVANTGTGSTNKPVQVVACFELDASSDVDDGSASANVSLGSTMLVVQEASVSNFN